MNYCKKGKAYIFQIQCLKYVCSCKKKKRKGKKQKVYKLT